MNRFFNIFLFSLIFSPCWSVPDTTYYDADKKAVPSPKKASFYNVTTRQSGKWLTMDYYMTGQLQSVGYLKDPITRIKDGLFSCYYRGGQLKSEGKYVNGLKENSHVYYYPSGQLQEVLTYEKGSLHGKAKYYFKNGNKRSELMYEQDVLEGLAIFYHQNGAKAEEGHFRKNLKSGMWNYWYATGESKGHEVYDDYFELEEPRIKLSFPNHHWYLDSKVNSSHYVIYSFERISAEGQPEAGSGVNLTLLVEDVGELADAVRYSSEKLNKVQFKVNKVLFPDQKEIAMNNAVGYIGETSYKDGEHHKLLVLYGINNKKGIQAVINVTADLFEETKQELSAILASIDKI